MALQEFQMHDINELTQTRRKKLQRALACYKSARICCKREDETICTLCEQCVKAYYNKSIRRMSAPGQTDPGQPS